jgi:hypothetical protein
MKKVLTAALVVTLSACGLAKKGDDFRDGVPSSDQVTMKVPGSTNKLSAQALEGETAGMYALTRVVTLVVNGGGAAVLLLVEKITDYDPTTITGNVAVWGPYTDALSPNTYKFTVTRNKQDDHSYVLEAKGKNEGDDKFRVILSGSHVNTGKNLGSGTFLLDWNKIQELPEHGKEVGTAQYTYSHKTAADPIVIDAIFTQVKDEKTGKLQDINYKYNAKPGSGGAFEFKVTNNVDNKGVPETVAVKSRWNEAGDGRSDAKAAGGDLQTEATFSECWDSNFASKFLVMSFAPTSGWGKDSACTFANAEYSQFAP